MPYFQLVKFRIGINLTIKKVSHYFKSKFFEPFIFLKQLQAKSLVIAIALRLN
jgi:hypothetical protein